MRLGWIEAVGELSLVRQCELARVSRATVYRPRAVAVPDDDDLVLCALIDEHGFVAGVVVHHQVAAPAVQECARVSAGAAGLVVEHEDRRAVVVHAGTIGPEVGVARLAGPRVELAHRRFIGMQAIVLPQQFGQPVRQRLQGHADEADPVGQGRTGQRHTLARCDLLDPVQRQVVEILAGGDQGQQSHCGHAAIDDSSRDRRCRDRLAWAAGVLRTDMAVHEEARWLPVQLLADILADLDQVDAALARLGLMEVLDALQFRRQRLPAGALAWRFEGCLAAQFLIDGREVHIDGLVEQQALFANQCFAGLAEAHTLVLDQLERQRLDLEVILGQLGLLLFDQHLQQQRCSDVGAGKFVKQVHAEQLIGPGRRLQAQQYAAS